MNRIEEIKQTHSWVKKENSKEPLKNETAQYWVERYISDAECLLSKLEIAEEALRKISVPMPGSRENELVKYYERIASETLEKLQK